MELFDRLAQSKFRSVFSSERKRIRLMQQTKAEKK